MRWIERFGDLAAETSLPLHAGQQTGLQASDFWSKMKMKKQYSLASLTDEH